MTEAADAPPRRGLLDYTRDGWRLGEAVYQLALRRPELRRFAATTFGIVVVIEVMMTVGTLLIRHEGTITQRIAWALGEGYVVAFLSNLAAVGLAGLSDGILAGRPVELSQGWRLMGRRIPNVAGWALLVIAVGIPARLMTGWVLDQLLAVLLGFGFAVLTFFAVPAIALRGDGAIGAAKRSLHLVGRRWGTQVVGMVYVWLRPFAYFGLPGLIAVIAGFALERNGFDFLGWTIGLAGALALALTYLLIVSSNSVLSVALFRFAEGADLPAELDRALLARVLRGPAPVVTRMVRRLDGERAAKLRRHIASLTDMTDRHESDSEEGSSGHP